LKTPGRLLDRSSALTPSTEVRALYANNTAGAARANASSVTLQNGTTLGPANGLVGHWTFDGADIVGTIADRAGSNHGYFIGGATSSAKTIGKLGQALNFDGIDDYVSATNESNFDFARTNAFSLSIWARGLGSDEDLIGKFNSVGYVLYEDVSQKLSFDLITSTESMRMKTNSTYVSNEWAHVAVTYDGSSNNNGMKVYVNGQNVAATVNGDTSVTGSILNNANLTIGRLDPCCYFDGNLDDARVYNRALTADEVKALYKLGTVRITQ
jgi:hypothetical protein